jgi:hypothetical protein
VTGEPFDGFNWAPGEPNNTFFGPVPGFGGEDIPIGSPESFLHYKAVDDALLIPLGWNDLPGDSQISAYVVEAAPIPVPASIVVMITGVVALVGVSRRRSKRA